MVPKTYSVADVYDNAYLDLTYEFFCSKHPSLMTEQLGYMLNANVVLTNDPRYQPTPLNSILLKEYNGDKPRYQLKTGGNLYSDMSARNRLILMWINENAELDHFTNLKMGLHFNHGSLQTLRSISNMDIGKMVLRINENYIAERFPEFRKNPFSLSIKKIIPQNNFINASSVISNMSGVFQLPIQEYYGIDFTNYTRGILTFNYIGGPNYSAKPDQIQELLEYFVITTYQTLNEEGYTRDEIQEMQRLSADYLKLRSLYYNPDKFLQENKDIKVSCDLNLDPMIVKSKWSFLRDPLFKVMFEAGFKKGKFNWDSESGSFQIKDAELSGTKIQGFDLVNCKIQGSIIERSHLWRSNVTGSRIQSSTLISENKIEESFLENIRADRGNTISKGYIKNDGEILNCKIEESVILRAGIGKNATLSENCTLIETRDFKIPISRGVEIPEVRDYLWIKSLSGSKKDSEFGNIFKTSYDS